MKRKSFFFIFLLSTISYLYSQENSVLSNGDWYKIATNNNAIYKLDYSDFLELGCNINNLKIESIRLYGNGGGMLPKLNSEFRYHDLVENNIKIYDQNNNGFFDNFDYILFYGQSPHTWKLDSLTGLFEYETHLFSDEVFYYLNIDNTHSSSKRINQKPTLSNPTKVITSFDDFLVHELELINLIGSGRKWYGESFFSNDNKNFSFDFPNLILSENVTIKTAVVGRSLNPSIFNVAIQGGNSSDIVLPNISNNYASEFAKEGSDITMFNVNSSLFTVNIEYSSNDPSAQGWLDFIEINARRKLKMHGDVMRFRDRTNLFEEIGRFEIENAAGFKIWDITDPINVFEIATVLSGESLSFNDSLNYLHEYIVFNSESYLDPKLIGHVDNQNLHNLDSEIEYIIISHSDFILNSNQLAAFHENQDGLKSTVVTVDQIYNEFSSGMQDVSAIRDFIRWQYKKIDSNLKYVLLFGDGSYDPKDRIANNTNYIPTYQSENSTHPTYSYVTDDFFVLLDDNEGLFLNDLVNIGIGRLPVSNQFEANILINKIENYYSKESFGKWRNNVVFIADDGDASDGNTFMADSDSLSNIISENYEFLNIEKIYLDNYLQEATSGGPRSVAAQDAINNTIDRGVLLVNYIGHGGQLGWTQERILEVDQINNWNNRNKLPLFMTATCKFAPFDNPEKKSAGEYVIMNEHGGAIALLTTTRLVYSDPNYKLNKNFINVLFEKNNTEYPRLGDVFKKAKVLSGTNLNNRNFTLLGDPALRLAYPTFDIITDVINDTLKALGEVTIEGSVTDNDIVFSSFNGTIYSTVYDKEIVRTTLGQESCTPMPYKDQNNIIYRGSSSVVDGKFSFSFIVPKDINYDLGKGKISYYAIDQEGKPIDANGSETDFFVGGTADNIIYDYDGPEITLFMNTRSFKNGGITDAKPVLLADFFDISGINTAGNGIGHDITAFIDENTANSFVLNDFYESNKNDYTRGSIAFSLSDLDPGKHVLTLKAWDVFNNSATKSIEFIVSDDNEIIVQDFNIYPNPFVTHTDIYFEHNQPNQNLNVSIEVYTTTGVLVSIIKNIYNDSGYNIGPITWNGRDRYGMKMSAGVYIMRLVVRDEDGSISSNSKRIILLPEY